VTRIGTRRVNAKGRSAGQFRTNRFAKIRGQFAPRRIEMLESPADRVLSLSGHRVLARLEIAHHGGTPLKQLATVTEVSCAETQKANGGIRTASMGQNGTETSSCPLGETSIPSMPEEPPVLSIFGGGRADASAAEHSNPRIQPSDTEQVNDPSVQEQLAAALHILAGEQ
jgi:hypothetical protein